MRHTFNAEQWLPYPVATVFTFFANTENLPRLMPAWQKTRIDKVFILPPPLEQGSSPESRQTAAGSGSLITISFRPIPYSPVRISWDAKISEFTWNDHFCDTQLRGPFTFWHHCHTVERQSRSDKNGLFVAGTSVRDQVEYELPFGWLGEVGQALFAKRQMEGIFNHRHKRTAELLALAC